MTERKVLIVRVKGGMQIAQGVTNHIIEGLVRGVLVLPEEVSPTPLRSSLRWAWRMRTPSIRSCRRAYRR